MVQSVVPLELINPRSTLYPIMGRPLFHVGAAHVRVAEFDETEEKIYGLDRVDYGQRIYVVEGPIDSLFLPNAIAVSGSSFDTPTIRKLLSNATIVMDNEPRNKQIVSNIRKTISLGRKVCIWPDTIHQKDINDMVLHGKTINMIMDTINTNTFQGMAAKLRFTEWRKC